MDALPGDYLGTARLMFGALGPEFWLLLLAAVIVPLVIQIARHAWSLHLNNLAIDRGIASLEYVMQMSGTEFEVFCAQYFRECGYHVRLTRTSGDHGVDLILTAPQERLVVQCKRHARPVGEPVIRDLYGAVLHDGASGGIVCASEGFTRPAREWAQGKHITLLSGEHIWRELVRSRA